MVSSSILERISLAETVLHQSAQIGILDMCAGNVLGHIGLISKSIFGKAHYPSSEVRGEREVLLSENS